MSTFRQKIAEVKNAPRKTKRQRSVRAVVYLSPVLAELVLHIHEQQKRINPVPYISLGHTLRYLIGLGIHRHGEQRRVTKFFTKK